MDAHIFLCILAYYILTAIEKTMLDAGVHSSWETVRNAVKTHQVCTVVLPTETGAVLRIRQSSTPEPQHKVIYDLLGVSAQVMKPKKTWSAPGESTNASGHSDQNRVRINVSKDL